MDDGMRSAQTLRNRIKKAQHELEKHGISSEKRDRLVSRLAVDSEDLKLAEFDEGVLPIRVAAYA
jgi:hypothetical protein